MYQDIYNCICQNTKKIRFIIHYVKPTAQLLFRIRFPKGGPTCRRQVVNPRHQTPQGQSVAKPHIKYTYNIKPFTQSILDGIMGAMASQITGVTIVYSTVCRGADQRKHQSSASLAFVRGLHRPPVNFPHLRQVSRKLFTFDDVIMEIIT